MPSYYSSTLNPAITIKILWELFEKKLAFPSVTSFRNFVTFCDYLHTTYLCTCTYQNIPFQCKFMKWKLLMLTFSPAVNTTSSLQRELVKRYTGSTQCKFWWILIRFYSLTYSFCYKYFSYIVKNTTIFCRKYKKISYWKQHVIN